MRERIVAHDGGSRDLIDDMCDHAFVGDGGEPVADEAGVGLDLDQAARHGSRPRRAHERNVERHVDRGGGDFCDFHELNARSTWRDRILARGRENRNGSNRGVSFEPAEQANCLIATSWRVRQLPWRTAE
jgi:hypothetical protein